jgi:Tfp pilus assembly protein PilN
MIRINLLPEREFVFDRGRKRELAVLVGALLLLVLALGLVYQARSARASALKREIVEAEARAKGLEKLKTESAKLNEMKKDLSMRLKVVRDLEAKRVGPSKVLEELSLGTPDLLWLTELSESGGKAKLTGLAWDHASISSFLIKLAGSSRFANVDLVEVVEEERNGRHVQRFSASADFKY